MNLVSAEQLLEPLLRSARAAVEAGHPVLGAASYLRKGVPLVTIHFGVPEHPDAKIRMASGVGTLAVALGADTLMTVYDLWLTLGDERLEGLAATTLTRRGVQSYRVYPYRRVAGAVVWDPLDATAVVERASMVYRQFHAMRAGTGRVTLNPLVVLKVMREYAVDGTVQVMSLSKAGLHALGLKADQP